MVRVDLPEGGQAEVIEGSVGTDPPGGNRAGPAVPRGLPAGSTVFESQSSAALASVGIDRLLGRQTTPADVGVVTRTPAGSPAQTGVDPTADISLNPDIDLGGSGSGAADGLVSVVAVIGLLIAGILALQAFFKGLGEGVFG